MVQALGQVPGLLNMFFSHQFRELQRLSQT
jgi:hypothetical protein